MTSGDRVLLASDGLPEALDVHGAPLGIAPVEEAGRDAAVTADELVSRLIEIQREHSGGPSQTDDVTLLYVDRV